MTEPTAATKRGVRPLTWAALAVSAAIAAVVWFAFVANAEILSGLPEEFRNGDVLFYLIYAIPADLILITWAGSRGGKNHRLSILALGILFSPLLYFVGGLIIYAIFPR